MSDVIQFAPWAAQRDAALRDHLKWVVSEMMALAASVEKKNPSPRALAAAHRVMELALEVEKNYPPEA